MNFPSLEERGHLGLASHTRPRWSSPQPNASPVFWQWPPDGQVRARKLLSRGAMRPIYRYPSLKLRREVHLESSLEYRFAVLFDTCPQVTTFSEQPVLLTLRLAGGMIQHYPDFAITHRGRNTFIEVKFKADIDEEIQWRTELIRTMLQRWDIDYRLITEDDLPSTVRTANATALSQRGRGRFDPLMSRIMLDKVRNGYAGTIGELGWSDSGSSAAIVYGVLNQLLHVDLSREIDDGSAVSDVEHSEGWLWA